MGFIKNNFLTILLGLAIVSMLAGLYIMSRKVQRDTDSLRKQVIEKDSLLKVRDGQYTKLVNDTKKDKELRDMVKDQNPETYEDIKKNKEKVVSNTNISVTPVNKVTRDTVYVKDNDVREVTSYYPNIDSAHITHRSIVYKDYSENSWEFKPLKLDVIVTQQKDGLYRARLIGPKWIQAQEVTVNSLPMSPMTQKNFKALIGASGGYSFQDNNMTIGIYTGFRYKNKILLLHGGTNKVVSLGYIQEF